MKFGAMNRPILCGVGFAALLYAIPVAAQDDSAEQDANAPTGLAVDGVIRSNQGGFAFPDGARMSAPPSLESGGPFTCAPAAGESQTCPIAGEWDFCSLGGIAMARFNAFIETSCDVVNRGGGTWAINVVSTGQFVVRCSANCMKLNTR
jgi:hypothetical protein